jgi:segregation and condensation protein B
MARQPDMDPILIRRIIEAALLAATQPLPMAQLLALFADTDQVDADAIGRAVEELRAESATRGVELVEVSSGLRFQIAADVHPYVAKLWTERQTKYSRALLETLALIAYRQPITRGEIEQIRGVTVASSIMRTLEEREWIRVVGHRDVPGRPALFGTTRQFLDYFSLKSLDELPPLAAIRDLSEIEPQLSLPVEDGEEPRAPAIEIEAEGTDEGSIDPLTGPSAIEDATDPDTPPAASTHPTARDNAPAPEQTE